MRWIVLTVVLAALCLGAMEIVKRRLRDQEAMQRAPAQQRSRADLSRSGQSDGTFPAAPVHNYQAEVAQFAAQLADRDPSTRAAVMDVLSSLPGDALPAIQAAAGDTRLSSSVQAALHDLLPLYKARAARQSAMRQERQACLRESLAAYDKYGHHYLKWDARVRAALTAFYQSDPPPDRTPAQEAWIIKAMKEIVLDYECDDPVVLFTYGLMLQEIPSSPLKEPNLAIEAFQNAVLHAASNRWPAELQALFKARVAAETGQYSNLAIGRFKFGINDIAEFVAAPWPSSQDKLDWAMNIVLNQNDEHAFFHLERATESAPGPVDMFSIYQPLHDAMQNRFPGGIEPLIFTGEFYIRYAWQARGRGSADTVTQEGWKLFQERLLIAKEALEKAHELNPNDPRCCSDMITVCMGLGEDLVVARPWFDRAMAADPDYYDAVNPIMLDLEPKWGGSPQLLLQFAEERRATHNYRGQMPFAMVHAYLTLAEYGPPMTGLLNPSEVWDSIRSVYESYLALFPNDRRRRTLYLAACTGASKWKEARAQFDLLGDRPWPGIFAGNSYNTLRKQAERDGG